MPHDEIVEHLFALWRDPPSDDEAALSAFRALYADPVEVNGASFTAGDLLARARVLHRAYSDLHHELIDVIAPPGRLVVAFLMSGTHTGPLPTSLGTVAPTGRRVSIRTIDVLAVAGGRIVSVTVVGDELGALVGLDAVALRA